MADISAPNTHNDVAMNQQLIPRCYMKAWKHNSGKDPKVWLFDKGEYNAAVIAAFRLLETTLSRKYDFARLSLMESLNLLNTNNAEDKEV